MRECIGERSPNFVTLPDWVILGKAPTQVLPFSQESNSLPTIEVRLDDLEVTVLNTEVRIFLRDDLHFEQHREAHWTKNITLPPNLP